MKISPKVGLMGAGAVVLIGIVATLVLLFVPLFQVAKFDITGNRTTSTEDIQAAAGIAPGTALVRTNTTQAARNVAALPWIAKVEVDRAFPNTIKVAVEERTAVLFAEREDGPHLFDATGRPFVIEQPPLGCAKVTGTKDDDPALFSDIASAVSALDPATREKLERVDAPSKYELRLFFAGGKEVYWGSTEQTHDKAKATATVLQREGKRWNVSAPGMVTLIP